MERKKLGLSIRGAGASGAAYVGSIMALEESGISANVLTAASSGAIVAANYAFGRSFPDLIDLLRRYSFRSLISLRELPRLHPWSLDKIHRIASDYFGDLDIKDAKIKLFIEVIDNITGKLTYVDNGNVADILTATIAHPYLTRPYRIGDNSFVDGGFAYNFGSSKLKESGADVVVGLYSSPVFEPKYPIGNPVVMLHTLKMELLRRNLALDPIDLLIEDLGSISLVDFKNAEKLIEPAYRKTLARIPEILTLLDAN